MSDREEQAKRNRERMPEVSAFVDQMRQLAPVKVLYAEENGHVLGKKPEHWDDEETS